MEVLVALAPAIGAALSTLIGLGATYLTALIAKKTKNQYLKDVLDMVVSLSKDIVLSLNQTVVDQLKAGAADGKWTKEDKSRLLNEALAALKAQLGAKAVMELQRHLGSAKALNDFLITKIEAAVSSSKK